MTCSIQRTEQRKAPGELGAGGISLTAWDLGRSACGSFGQSPGLSSLCLPLTSGGSFLPSWFPGPHVAPSLSPSSQARDGRAMAPAVEGGAHHFTVSKSALLKASASISQG